MTTLTYILLLAGIVLALLEVGRSTKLARFNNTKYNYFHAPIYFYFRKKVFYTIVVLVVFAYLTTI